MQLEHTYKGNLLQIPVGESADGEAKAFVTVQVVGTATVHIDGVPVLLFVHRHVKIPKMFVLSHWESGRSLGVHAYTIPALLAAGELRLRFNRDEATGLLHLLRCAAFDDHLNDLPKDDEL